jgi:hypothetical protein
MRNGEPPQPNGLRDTEFRDQIIDLNEIRDGEGENRRMHERCGICRLGFGIVLDLDIRIHPYGYSRRYSQIKNLSICGIGFSISCLVLV